MKRASSIRSACRCLVPAFALVLSALILVACASAPNAPAPRETVARAVAAGLGEGIWPEAAEDREDWRRRRLEALLDETLDAAAILEIAALADFETIAMLADLDRHRADTEQAGLLGNPRLRLMAMRPEAGGTTMLDYGLMQDLIDLLTRDRRLAVAEATERAAAYRTAEAIMHRLWSAEAAFVVATATRERAGLWAQRGELAAERVGLARALHGRGALPLTDAVDQRATAARLLQAALQADDDARIAKAGLAEALGLASADRLRLPDTLPEPVLEIDSTEMLHTAARRLRLDLLAAQAVVLRDEENRALIQRWRHLPRLDVGVAGEREADGTGGLGGEIALTVPLFDRGQARLAGADAELSASQARVEAAQRRIEAGVDRAFEQWRRERNRAERLANEVQPRLTEQLALRERGYRDGLEDRFSVLDAADAVLALAIEQLDADEAAGLARIELSRQTGSTLPLDEP